MDLTLIPNPILLRGMVRRFVTFAVRGRRSGNAIGAWWVS